MRLEWDARKAAANQRKHGVSFAEASSVFTDPLSATGDDPDHSIDQKRFVTFGVSSAGRLSIGDRAFSGGRPYSNYQRPEGDAGRKEPL